MLEINYPRTSVENDVELELGLKEVVERWELSKQWRVVHKKLLRWFVNWT